MAKMTVTVDGAGVFVRGLTPIDVDKIRAEGRCAEVLRAIVHDARQLCYKADMQQGHTSWGCHNCLHGDKGGWRENNAWPCNVCRVGPDLCCGEDNWKPNAQISGGNPSAESDCPAGGDA